MSIAVIESPRSVLDVLGRLDVALTDLEHALVLGPGGAVLGGTANGSVELTRLVQALSATLVSPDARLAGESARCVVTLSQHCVFVYVLGDDITVGLVGPPNWNIALTSRLVEPLLVSFVDHYLLDLATATAAARRESAASLVPAPLPTRVSTRRDTPTAAGVPTGTPSTARQRPDILRDVDLLDQVLSGLASL